MKKERTFQELLTMTRQVIQAFNAVEQRPWTIETTMIELMKQVGDLAKHMRRLASHATPLSRYANGISLADWKRSCLTKSNNAIARR